ncbi:lipid A deacylase LpxR family protein [Vibrio sp. SM6]|uniref:Lipid A deacylase LpxR family protein n=1 Tax=Vibrio agarilyticus TaxID=2726741 RepID=A0A7X8TMS8_9VIBR|nr:lipid A deacylase LpxR family protein [Vibrio agarilyticus]NLS11327.1 lipid A deacylase LpxR family protein [Vibrio agarilyticus]
MKKSLFFAAALTASSVFASPQATFSFNLDNDGIFGVDKDYTNGVFFAYASPALSADNQWFLSQSTNDVSSVDKFQLSIGHKMWTPKTIESAEPISGERPYTGLLHLDASYSSQIEGQTIRYSAMLGTTGENAFSEEAQKLVHSITGSPEPQGWDHQTENTVVAALGYQRFDRLMHGLTVNQNEWEVSNLFDATAGNFRSDIATGVMVRFGRQLQSSLGAAQINSENPFNPAMLGLERQGWFVFAGIKGRYRFNDLSIEGDRNNLPHPKSAYQVTLQPWQSEFSLGGTWYQAQYGLSFALTARTSDFKESHSRGNANGSVSAFMFF